MERKSDCPHCGEDIGLWPIISAGLPNRIKCPRCKTRLRFKTNSWLHFFFVALPLLVLFLAVSQWITEYLASSAPRSMQILIFTILFVSLWLLYEIPNAIYLRKSKVLETVRKNKI